MTGRSRLRNALMAIQVALALVVLVAAGLFLRSFLETRDTDTGFRREGVLLAAYDLTGRNTADGYARRSPAACSSACARYRRSRGLRLRRRSRSTSMACPRASSASRAGRAPRLAFDQALANTVTPGYFAVMGIPLVAGKDFARSTTRRRRRRPL